MKKPRYILIGGFLGAGKTSAILRLAKELRDRSKAVAVVTNDQSDHLTDTARVRAARLPVREITGGCFCCRFDDLVTASYQLAESNHPDVLLAEPVGSCTDLQATVGHPLRRYEGADFDVAPYSVLVDPVLCGQILEGSASFTDNVNYIYRKQLEEADRIVVNKIDLLTPEAQASLCDRLQHAYPQAVIHRISCVTGEGLEDWLNDLLTQPPRMQPIMEVDYDRYADGEARLGWLNLSADVHSARPIDGDAQLMDLCQRIMHDIGSPHTPIAHLKLSLAIPGDAGLASVSFTHPATAPRATSLLKKPVTQGELTINLRAEQDPEILQAQVQALLGRSEGLSIRVQTLAAFRPGRPTPTHRIQTV